MSDRFLLSSLMLVISAVHCSASLMSTVQVPNEGDPPGGWVYDTTTTNNAISITSTPGTNLFAEARAQSDYGLLRTYAYSYVDEKHAWSSIAFAYFDDILMITMPTAGNLTLHVSTDGTNQFADSTGGFDQQAFHLTWAITGVDAPVQDDCQTEQTNEAVNPNGACTLNVALNAGAWRLAIKGEMRVETVGRLSHTYIDAYNTSKLTGIGALDLSGARLNPAISSSSGTEYPALADAATPEPTTWGFVASGLLAALVRNGKLQKR